MYCTILVNGFRETVFFSAEVFATREASFMNGEKRISGEFENPSYNI